MYICTYIYITVYILSIFTCVSIYIYIFIEICTWARGGFVCEDGLEQAKSHWPSSRSSSTGQMMDWFGKMECTGINLLWFSRKMHWLNPLLSFKPPTGWARPSVSAETSNGHSVLWSPAMKIAGFPGCQKKGMRFWDYSKSYIIQVVKSVAKNGFLNGWEWLMVMNCD